MSKSSRPLKTFKKHVSQEKEKPFKQLKMHINQKPAQNATETNWLKECYRRPPLPSIPTEKRPNCGGWSTLLKPITPFDVKIGLNRFK